MLPRRSIVPRREGSLLFGCHARHALGGRGRWGRRRGRTSRLALSGASRGVAVGDVVYLHDAVTGFSRKDCMRWCVVTAVLDRHVRVAGRSASRTDGVLVPQSVMAAFTADGWFLRPPLRISLADACAARNIGSLPEHYLAQVLFFVDEDLP